MLLDANANGLMDAGEQSALTGSDGRYSFIDLAEGEHRVTVAQPDGYVRTWPLDAHGYGGELVGSTVASAADFGFIPVGEVRGTKFHELGLVTRHDGSWATEVLVSSDGRTFVQYKTNVPYSRSAAA